MQQLCSKFVNDLHEKIGTTGLALSSAATLIVGAVYAYHLNLSLKRIGEVPVHWSWLPVLGNAIDMGSRPLEFLSECAAEHEDIFGMVVAGNRMFIISDVFSSNLILKPPKSFSWEEFHDLVLSNFFGAEWNSSGHHGVNSFDEQLMRNCDSALGKLTMRMQAQLARDTDRLTASGTAAVPFYELLSRLIFQASVAALLTPEAADDSTLFEAFKVFDQHLPLAAGGFKVSYAKAPREARELLYRAVRKYESADNCEFIKKRFEYFDSFGNRHNTVAFQLAMVWASVGNTMPSVFWLVFFLMRNPAAMQAVLEEIQSVHPATDGSCSTDFTQDELNRMTYMDACITETLRLCSGSLIMRHVKEPCEITLASGKSYRFRQGDRVGLCPPLWHRDAELYPQPFSFNPARWLPAEATTPEEVSVASQGKVQLHKAGKPLPMGAGYMPFGGGVTFCPGRRFARNEVKTLVAVLLVNFRFEFADSDTQPDFDGARAGLGIFPPKTDVLVRVTRKS